MRATLGFTPEGYLDVPVTKPATEFFDGLLVQKMSPLGSHGCLQATMSLFVMLWNRQGPFGWIATEWDFDLVLPDDSLARVVPDVAYVSYQRIPRGQRQLAQVPRMAPTVAFEILSPNDPNRPNVERKLTLYREAGAEGVVVIDEHTRTVTVRDRIEERTYREGDVLEIAAMPGFKLDVAEYFREAQV